MASHPNVKIQYYACNMMFNIIYSEAFYLLAPKGGHFYLGSLPNKGCPIKINGTIITFGTILRYVAASVAKAELGTLFVEAKIMHLTLTRLTVPLVLN